MTTTWRVLSAMRNGSATLSDVEAALPDISRSRLTRVIGVLHQAGRLRQVGVRQMPVNRGAGENVYVVLEREP